MNIFRTIASGKHAFREEFVSAFLAYLLSTKMDHGLNFTFLSKLLSRIAEQGNATSLKGLSECFKCRLWENIFDENEDLLLVELEFRYPGGFIDVVIKCGDWFIMIENKIVQASKTRNQLKEQYRGLLQVMREKGFAEGCRVLVIYLVPASQSGGEWAVSPGFYNELEKVELREDDQKALVSWQPVTCDDGDGLSIVSIVREILEQESKGLIAPISSDVRHALLSLIDFALGEFQGFHYEKATSKTTNATLMKVSDVLKLEGNYHVGIRYGRGGTVDKAWKNPGFLNETVRLTEDEGRGWMYVPLAVFNTLVKWCLDPEKNSLEALKWTGTPFGTCGLYRIAKYGKPNMYIGIRGGVKTLKALTAEQIQNRKAWELDSQKKSSDWMTCRDFCSILEEKEIRY